MALGFRDRLHEGPVEGSSRDTLVVQLRRLGLGVMDWWGSRVQG